LASSIFPAPGEVHMDSTVVLVSLALSLPPDSLSGSFPIAGISSISVTTRFMRTAELAPQEKNLVRPSLLVAGQDWICIRAAHGRGLLLASFRLLFKSIRDSTRTAWSPLPSPCRAPKTTSLSFRVAL